MENVVIFFKYVDFFNISDGLNIEFFESGLEFLVIILRGGDRFFDDFLLGSIFVVYYLIYVVFCVGVKIDRVCECERK